MGQCDNVLVSVARVPKVWNEGEDFGRDLVDRRENVSPDANQAEDLDSVLLEGVELKFNACQLQSTRPFSLVRLTSALSGAVATL